MKTFLALLIATISLSAAEPKRENGLSVHLLPDRVAKIDGARGGFTVTTPTGKDTTYTEAKPLLAYFHGLPTETQQNGIWVVTTHPSSYSEAEQARLQSLIDLCTKSGIPIYTRRGSELPSGWKRAK